MLELRESAVTAGEEGVTTCGAGEAVFADRS
jgi:hypothetical protein